MFKTLVIAGLAGLMVGAMPAGVRAQDPEARKVTYLTFSGPVELPGFGLPAGTYRFSLADPDSTRRVIEVATQDGSKTYGLILTIPDQRLEKHDDPVVLFRETPTGTPAAVRAWFYPGESTGYELVYPRKQAMALAKTTHERVLSSDASSEGSRDERVHAMHGARVGRVDENGEFSDEADATSGNPEHPTKPADTKKDGDRKR
jgi:hypothetical protein